jgi:ribosome maturation factor RimP
MDGRNRHERLCEEIHSLATTAARSSGVEVVEVRVRGSAGKRVVRVDIDRAGPVRVTLGDCQAVSAQLATAIDEAGVLDDTYVLELSSPGADRPIRTADDIRRNAGRRIEIIACSPLGGRTDFRGVLSGLVDGQMCWVDDESGEMRIPLEHVAIARQEIAF